MVSFVMFDRSGLFRVLLLIFSVVFYIYDPVLMVSSGLFYRLFFCCFYDS